MRQIMRTALVLLAMASHVLADGKMFWKEEIPPVIPYQRALILFRDGTETLILQSKYEIPKTAKKSSLGWVVPVPAVPEIASMPANLARDMFWKLNICAHPDVTRISNVFYATLFFGIGGLSLLTLLLCLISFALPSRAFLRRHRGTLAENSLMGLLFCTVMYMFLCLTATAGKGIGDGVDVIAEQRVGIYDVQVVKASDSKNLVAWLNAGEFRFGDKDKAAFDSYLAKGWCFVVAHINPTAEQGGAEIVSEGLAAPLILRFPHPAPIYPLVLTGTGNHKTEILIYLAADMKMTCGDRLKLRFAKEMDSRAYLAWALSNLSGIEPQGFILQDDPSYPYLCKFRDTLTPADMAQDLTFTPAADSQPFREHLTKW